MTLMLQHYLMTSYLGYMKLFVFILLFAFCFPLSCFLLPIFFSKFGFEVSNNVTFKKNKASFPLNVRFNFKLSKKFAKLSFWFFLKQMTKPSLASLTL